MLCLALLCLAFACLLACALVTLACYACLHACLPACLALLCLALPCLANSAASGATLMSDLAWLQQSRLAMHRTFHQLQLDKHLPGPCLRHIWLAGLFTVNQVRTSARAAGDMSTSVMASTSCWVALTSCLSLGSLAPFWPACFRGKSEAFPCKGSKPPWEPFCAKPPLNQLSHLNCQSQPLNQPPLHPLNHPPPGLGNAGAPGSPTLAAWSVLRSETSGSWKTAGRSCGACSPGRLYLMHLHQSFHVVLLGPPRKRIAHLRPGTMLFPLATAEPHKA